MHDHAGSNGHSDKHDNYDSMLTIRFTTAAMPVTADAPKDFVSAFGVGRSLSIGITGLEAVFETQWRS
ncbi:hypothetical protein [Hyphomicrobium sp.]|uniref:hypothetical protein n=1 Tax=Hyphomicrobium sp. TaxID=82 RepID=UPI000FB26C41|nr:hypothetical protein [Hyphomicrobium sp.]RUP07816.1 MAG: hypothetical protein EKK38_17710 [Hyphomicrobium sp.]